MRGPLCKVCTSPMRALIDADMLSGGMTLRQISAKFGIGHTTLHNHRVRCQGIAPTRKPGPPHTPEDDARSRQKRKEAAAPSRIAALEAGLPSREELGATLEDCISRLDAIVTRNEDSGVDAVALKGLGEIRSTVSELAKLAGHVGAGSTQNINVGVQVSVSANDIASALAQHLTGSTVKPATLLELAADE